ncbi:MAG: hypothetical protein OXT09_03105 [Myxococcales bacterium]|nr:hypothetical protein [Myxococcales bacterium]
MSLLKRLLGGREPDEEARQADALFDAGEHGRAKLAYERAARAIEKAQPERAHQLMQRADACRDAIARTRMAEAERLLANGAEDLALAEWEAAIETAADTALVEQVEKRLAELAEAPEEEPPDPSALSADQRYEMITVSFDDARVEEYQALGVRMRDALLALYEERAAEARPQLEALLEEAEEPRYLHFEVARARLLTEDAERAREALRAFIATLGADQGGEPRLMAHMELASAARDADDFEGAIAEYEAAIDAVPADPRAYVTMAGFFRQEGLADEAIDVLSSATTVMGSMHPLVAFETGRAHADAGRTEQARTMLEEAARLAPPDDPLQERIQEAIEALSG